MLIAQLIKDLRIFMFKVQYIEWVDYGVNIDYLILIIFSNYITIFNEIYIQIHFYVMYNALGYLTNLEYS